MAQHVLVTDGETRAVVSVARGLRDAGFSVAAAASSDHRPAAAHWSRSVRERIVLPDPLRAKAAFLTTLHKLVSQDRFAVLMPGSDASLLAISEGRDRLTGHIRLGLPSHDRVLRCLDKGQLGLAAAHHELDPPPTVVCHSPAQALSVAAEIGFPLMVKPLSVIVENGGRAARASSALVSAPDELRRDIWSFGGAGLVQRWSDGDVVSFAGVFAGGRLLGEAYSRYHRTWHSAAGNACYSESLGAPDELRERVIGLLRDLGWEGLFELELIERPRAGWHAIDFNPRPYGSLALALGAGANLPAIWCTHLLGGDPTPVRALPGFRYRWTDADLRHALARTRTGRASEAASVLSVQRGVLHPYARGADAGPALARAIELGKVAASRARARRVGRPREPAAIVGAGPYGLATAAYLRHAGIDVRAFGTPLESWSRHMPAGMVLRSRRRSSNIADPDRALTIEDFERFAGRQLHSPSLTLQEFVDYGLWYQRQAVPDLDRRKVTEVTRSGDGFRLLLEDGEELTASRVIVAAGLVPFALRPAPFASLPSSACSHANQHDDLRVFAGQRVAVIGSGQSALESAALLHEGGADVEILARGEEIHWLGGDPANGVPVTAPPLRRIPISPPPTDVGGRLTGWIAAAPDVFRHLPQRVHPTISFRCIRPAGAAWLRARLADVPVTPRSTVTGAESHDGTVTLQLSDGSSRTVDHVLLGTGYVVDVRRYRFLSASMLRDLTLSGGYPVLGPGLESSIPGLHFTGAPAAHSFGPIMRFVVGTWYAAPAVARRAAAQRQPAIALSF